MFRSYRVSSPDGDRWKVRRRWLDRPAPKIREAIRRVDEHSPIDRLDVWAITDVSDGVAGTIAAAIAVAALALFLLPLVGIVLELAILIVLLCSGLAGRLLLRTPWVIEAINLDDPERSALFAVGGWQQSQRAMKALAQRIPVSGVPQDSSEDVSLAL